MVVIKALKNWRVVLLLVFLLFAVITIKPTPFNEGVTIRSVAPNSSALDAGIINPKPGIAPLAYERIITIDGTRIASLDDFYEVTHNLLPNQSVRIITNEQTYLLISSSGEDKLGLKVAAAPTSNIRKGLDLSGGSRVLLTPRGTVSEQDLETVIESLTQRLNVYGLSDVLVRASTDLSGNKFISVEMAGVTEEEVRTVITSQGKFEAKIGNETVFVGGKNDIPFVCRSPDCSGLNPRSPCRRQESGAYVCGFQFSISLSPDAAQKQADVTSTLDVVGDAGNYYLSQPLDLYLDDALVDTLQIAASLKGQASTEIAISGSGTGGTLQEAEEDTVQNMKQLQTVIVTGSLPVKLDIVKIDTVSPLLGEQFTRNIMLVGISVILAVALIVGIRYRRIAVVVPLVSVMLSEVILILGFAAIARWTLDLAGMAAIIIVIGTSVDHLIIITDETLRGEVAYDWKRRLKNAMFVIMGSYLTVVVGMLPLIWAGAGLLKAFALTTIAGVTLGVLIARPAYAALLKIILKE